MNDFTTIIIPDWLDLDELEGLEPFDIPETVYEPIIVDIVSVPNILPRVVHPSGIILRPDPKIYRAVALARKRHRIQFQADFRRMEQRKAFYAKYNCRVTSHNQRAKERNLPYNLTVWDWRRALNYFHGCCAVCGHQMRDLFGMQTISFDHWITLSDPRPDNPGTVAWNIVPLCHGEGGCNNFKGSKPAKEWVTNRYGKRKASQILKKINTYFAWVKIKKNLG